MKMSSVFEAVKAAIPLPEAAKRYGLDASGTGMICCPFHEDHNAKHEAVRRPLLLLRLRQAW